MSARRRIRLPIAALSLLVGCGAAGADLPSSTSPQPGPLPASNRTAARHPASPVPSVQAKTIAVELVNTPWVRAIDDMIEGRGDAVSVAVGVAHRIVYVHAADTLRILASNEKLLTSMAALDTFGARHRFPTVAASHSKSRDGVVHGDLWLIGSGDPELDESRLGTLAQRLVDSGIRRVTGAVMGDTSVFDRGWWAPGWLRGVSRNYVTRTTALAVGGNNVSHPEAAAAAMLTRALTGLGVRVGGTWDVGVAPDGTYPLATVRSAPLKDLVARQNHGSLNFYAEMLVKALGAEADGERGSTAAGALAIQEWARSRDVRAQIRDGSGLSHLDRSTAIGVVRLLLDAEREPWQAAFVGSLPAPGTGTLEGRLAGMPVRAKTGTLYIPLVSTLSGYVRTAGGATMAFSVLSQGLDGGTAASIEDGIVRILADVRVVAP